MMKALERQVAGFMLHNLIGKVAEMTFRTWEDGLAADADNDDQKFIIMKKGWRVRCYASALERRRRACLTLFVSLPLDHLWRHLQ